MQQVRYRKNKDSLLQGRKHISNETENRMLFEAIQPSREIAVVHCPAHTKGSSKTERSNQQIELQKLPHARVYTSVF